MNTRERKKLDKHYIRLVAETPAEGVADHLRQSDILTDELWEDIVYQNTEKNKVRQLLRTLVRRGPKAYDIFVEYIEYIYLLETLRLNDCQTLVQLLELRITNVLVQGDLGCPIDLYELTYRLRNVRYDPRTFSALIWQHRRIGGNCLIFSNGKINCNGNCSSISEGRKRLRRYARWLQKIGYPVYLSNVRLVTASATHQLSGRIEPGQLPKDFTFEPELFPAVMFRRHGMHFTCHLNGKMLITGIKRHRDLMDIFSVVLELELYLSDKIVHVA